MLLLSSSRRREAYVKAFIYWWDGAWKELFDFRRAFEPVRVNKSKAISFIKAMNTRIFDGIFNLLFTNKRLKI